MRITNSALLATIIIPTLNEEVTISEVIKKVNSLNFNKEIIVVDGLSTDKTVEIVKGLGVMVVLEKRKGKGIAVRTALKHVTAPLVVMIDGDGTYPVQMIPILLDYLTMDICDIVTCQRKWVDTNAMTVTNSIGNQLLSLMARILYWRKINDVCTGLWAIKMEKVDQFDLTSYGFPFEADLFINGVRTGCRHGELPIKYAKRIKGSTAKLKVRDGLKIGWFLIKRRFVKWV